MALHNAPSLPPRTRKPKRSKERGREGGREGEREGEEVREVGGGRREEEGDIERWRKSGEVAMMTFALDNINLIHLPRQEEAAL